MGMGNIMLSKMFLRQKDAQRMMTLICGVLKKKDNGFEGQEDCLI